MGSAAVAPQPHGAEEARGGRAAGHVPGPGAARFRAPGPENSLDPGQQTIKMRRVNGRRENPGWERGRGWEGKGKEKQEQAAFLPPVHLEGPSFEHWSGSPGQITFERMQITDRLFINF